MINATFSRSYADPKEIPAQGLPQVAFLGRSNAGKSSLINSLTGVKQLARVSSTPGRTRHINVFDVGGKYSLIDLPGYGYAKGSHREREQLIELIEGYLESSKLLRAAVVIVDSRLGPTESDRDLIAMLHAYNIPIILVPNKIDKLSHSEMTRILTEIGHTYPELTIIPHSAVSGAGRGELADAIRRQLEKKG